MRDLNGLKIKTNRCVAPSPSDEKLFNIERLSNSLEIKVDPELEAVLRSSGARTQQRLCGLPLVWRRVLGSGASGAMQHYALVKLADRLLKVQVNASDHENYMERVADESLRGVWKRPAYAVTLEDEHAEKDRLADEDMARFVSLTQRHVLRRLQESDTGGRYSTPQKKLKNKQLIMAANMITGSKDATGGAQPSFGSTVMDSTTMLRMLEPSTIASALPTGPRTGGGALAAARLASNSNTTRRRLAGRNVRLPALEDPAARGGDHYDPTA